MMQMLTHFTHFKSTFRPTGVLFERPTRMENQKTLDAVINETQLRSFNTFLSVYADILSKRFPDVTDLSAIHYDDIRGVAQFAAICSNVALETWQELLQPVQQRRNQMTRPTRAVG